jgi:hypothetical protein
LVKVVLQRLQERGHAHHRQVAQQQPLPIHRRTRATRPTWPEIRHRLISENRRDQPVDCC